MPPFENFVTALVLAFAISAVAFTLARTHITSGLREFAKSKGEFWGKLSGCPYCLSHWLSFGAVLIYRPRLVELFWPIDLLVTAMAIVTVSAVLVGAISRGMKS